MNIRKVAIVSITISIISYYFIYLIKPLLPSIYNDFLGVGLRLFPVALALIALGLSIYGFIIIVAKKNYIVEVVMMVVAAVIALNSVFWTTLHFTSLFRAFS